jgi:threonine/homoserine efflux transporter RhtA
VPTLRRSPIGPALLVVVAAISQEVGVAFAILTCLSPVGVAAIAGWLILGQHLAVTGYVAIVLVTVASIGAVRTARDRLAQSDTGLITA